MLNRLKIELKIINTVFTATYTGIYIFYIQEKRILIL